MVRRSNLDRDWSEARAKCDAEGRCRAAADSQFPCSGPLQAAHVVFRGVDRVQEGPRGGLRTVVDPLDIVPLCQIHHIAYDGHRFDLLPFLTVDEQAKAVGHMGLERARRRITGERA